MAQANDNFIMLPTVDFCFKELMQNENVRKGFISALLGRPPQGWHTAGSGNAGYLLCLLDQPGVILSGPDVHRAAEKGRFL